MNLPDLTPFFYLAIVGLVAILGGSLWLLYWIVMHLRIVFV